MKVSMQELYRIVGGDFLIGGSYVVNPDTANDIDILVHEHHAKHNYEGFHRLTTGDEKYDEIDSMRLIAVHEGRIDSTKYNIIVVGALFWPAYVGAVSEMTTNPSMYTTRDARIELHKGKCRAVAEIAQVELPTHAE